MSEEKKKCACCGGRLRPTWRGWFLICMKCGCRFCPECLKDLRGVPFCQAVSR